MRQPFLFISVIASIAVVSGTASAFVMGGSNFGILGYPKHRCYAPAKPFDLSDSFAVHQYNNGMQIYISCIREYVDSAKNDIERIREAANEAIDEANSK